MAQSEIRSIEIDMIWVIHLHVLHNFLQFMIQILIFRQQRTDSDHL